MADGGPRPSIRSVLFDTAGLVAGETADPARQLAWFTPDRDGIALFFFDRPPDIPPAGTRTELVGAMTRPGSHVELDVVTVGGIRSLRQIARFPQQPSGLTYLGSLIVPFRSLSYVLKVQCPERGSTGWREAVLLNDRLVAGFRPTTGPDGQLDLGPGWWPDSPEHDARFPDHPVSRVRRLLAHLQATVVLDPEVAALPPFPLP